MKKFTVCSLPLFVVAGDLTNLTMIIVLVVLQDWPRQLVPFVETEFSPI